MGLDSGGDFSHKLAAIYFQLVGTIFVFSPKMVSTVACCVRLYTKINLLLISRFRILLTRRVFRKWNTKKFVTNL